MTGPPAAGVLRMLVTELSSPGTVLDRPSESGRPSAHTDAVSVQSPTGSWIVMSPLWVASTVTVQARFSLYPATMEAADRYVEYRYLDHGNLPNYKKRKEFEGDTPSERYYREWFRDFNKALGFWQPGPGRPSNTSDHH